MDVLKNYDKVEAPLVTPTVAFKDLSLDSLDVVEVVMAIEEEFAIEIPDVSCFLLVTPNLFYAPSRRSSKPTRSRQLPMRSSMSPATPMPNNFLLLRKQPAPFFILFTFF